MDDIEIGGRRIGAGHPAFIIAELSANHGNSLEQALAVVQAAADAGADAIKLQTYTPDSMTIDCRNEYFRIKGTAWEGRNLYDLYAEAQTPWEWHEPLRDAAAGLGLGFFSTPFDARAVEFLETLHVPAYKIASFEVVDLPLLEAVGATGKPVIMSTGMATLGELEEAVGTLRRAGCTELALLKCTSAYPAPIEDVNLRTIEHLRETFGVPVGLSDHTLGVAVPVVAASLGASIVEKHLTLSRALGGPDSSFSLEPEEFRAMVDAVRAAEQALGKVRYGVSSGEVSTSAYRRSLFVVADVRAGEPFTQENVRSIRPGHGLPPRHLDDVLGRVAATDIERGTPLRWELVSGAGSATG